jgi:uncharacterized membrane protein YphA (DoxX/SURF4 family)
MVSMPLRAQMLPRWLHVLGAVPAGGLFLIAGISKGVDIGPLVSMIAEITGAPSGIAFLLGLLLIAVEIAGGLLLILGIAPRISAAALAGLVLSFLLIGPLLDSTEVFSRCHCLASSRSMPIPALRAGPGSWPGSWCCRLPFRSPRSLHLQAPLLLRSKAPWTMPAGSTRFLPAQRAPGHSSCLTSPISPARHATTTSSRQLMRSPGFRTRRKIAGSSSSCEEHPISPIRPKSACGAGSSQHGSTSQQQRSPIPSSSPVQTRRASWRSLTATEGSLPARRFRWRTPCESAC